MDFTGERLVPGKVDLELETEHVSRYIFASDFVRNKKVLDAACGTGYGSAMLAKTASKVFGVDISSEAIFYARSNYGVENINFSVADIGKLPFENDFFDVIVSFETIEHVDSQKQEKFLFEVKRTLKRNGIFVISTPNKDVYKNRGENHFHVAELSFSGFKNMLEKKFKNVKIFGQKFEVGNIISVNDVQNARFVGNLTPENSDYIIALCSEENLPNDLNSLVNIYDENKYAQLMNWTIENHERNEKNNVVIKNSFDKIEILSRKNESLQNEIATLDCENDKLERNLILEKTKSKQIREELERVYNSRGHKVLEKLYKLEGFIIPPGSRRRFILKMILKVVRHPATYLKKLTFTNLKKALRCVVHGDIYSLGEKMDILDVEKCTFVFEPVDFTQTEFEKLKLPVCDEPLVSIIIPVYNQFHYTYNCVKSLISHTRGIDYEVIIADDVSTDKTSEIENIIENIKVVHNEKNLGFLLNCNNAAKFARGKYIHFLNNDTYVQRGWLSSLLELVEKDDKIGLVGSKLVYPNGLLQEAGGIFWNDASAWNYGRGESPAAPEYNYVKEVDYISGASILILKRLWDEIGGFDSRFAPAYYEDSDLAFEVRGHGYKVIYQPESVVVHFEGTSNGTDTSTGVKAYQVQNKEKFFEKWKNVLQENHFENGENVFLARDHSKNKKCILFVDHYVPTFDKDAGSRATFQHLKLMVSLGYNIKFIGDNFLKYEKYTKALENLGIEVLYGPKYAFGWKNWVKENAKYIDTVVLSRPHIAKKYIDFIKQNTTAKVVYYIHDLHFLRYAREFETTKNPEAKKLSDHWKKVELDIMEMSDVVVTFSTDEKKIIDDRFHSEKAVVVPLFIYDKFNYETVNLSERRNLLFVGGFSHKPNEDAVLWFINDIWPRILKEVPDCKFIIAGSNPTEAICALASENIIITGFVSDELLKDYYERCRVCVIPLRFGAGVKGKTIEAMYSKIPIVSTPIGVEGLSEIEDYVASTSKADEFAKRVIEYYKNDLLAEKDAARYHEYLNKYFSNEYTTQIFKNIF